MLFQRTDGLHESAFKIGADTHDLSCGLHLGAQGALCADEFVKGQPWHLYHAVVQHGLKAGICFLCNRISDFVQGISQGDLGSYLGNGISRCLACQGR